MHLFLVFAFRDARFLSGLYHRFSYIVYDAIVTLHSPTLVGVEESSFHAVPAFVRMINTVPRRAITPSALLEVEAVRVEAEAEGVGVERHRQRRRRWSGDPPAPAVIPQ